jgi:hypothetical protein
MYVPKSRAPLGAFFLFLIPLLLQGCLGSIQYRPSAAIQSGLHADIFNFSNRGLPPTGWTTSTLKSPA